MPRSYFALVLGGARSGKSAYAEQWARERGPRVLFVATAEAGDEEMAARIARHRQARPSDWATLEAPLDVAAKLRAAWRGEPVILIDCLTLLVSNILGQTEDPLSSAARERVLQEVRALIETLRSLQAESLIVSNEVGLGLVPPYPLGRAYRDLLGEANQMVAREADEVILMVAGIPVVIDKKG